MKLNSLTKKNFGKKLQVLKILDSTFSNKLIELGFITGQTLEVVFSAPFGDPIAIELNGSVLSLRLEEAATIEVECINTF